VGATGWPSRFLGRADGVCVHLCPCTIPEACTLQQPPLHAQEAALDEQGKAEPPPDAVMEPEEPGAKCLPALPLFTSHSGHRRFIRTLKPPAGSSFKACLSRRLKNEQNMNSLLLWSSVIQVAQCCGTGRRRW